MPSYIEQMIATLSPDGVRIHLWKTPKGFQANVSEQSGAAWSTATADDPIAALSQALQFRVAGSPYRKVIFDGEPPETVSAEVAVIDAELEQRSAESHAEMKRRYDAAMAETKSIAPPVDDDDFERLLG